MATTLVQSPPRRCAPFESEPGYYEPANLWLYGNVRLLDSRLSFIGATMGPARHLPDDLAQIESLAEELVLNGLTLVTGVHNPAYQRSAVVPLRWGAPRVLILSGGFHYHLGQELKTEPFRAARLWRYEFDALTDLVISRRAPDKLPTYALHNKAVDRLVFRVASKMLPGVLFKEVSGASRA